jgi:site-specific recombinase XerD
MASTQELAIIPATSGSIVPWHETAERANEYVKHSKADATLRAYRADWASFKTWSANHGLDSLPADPRTVALYLADSATSVKVATLARRLAAISKAHQTAGYESPASLKHAAVSEVWKGIRRTHGVAQTQKAPTLIEDVRLMVGAITDVGKELIGLRDRALLLIGFAGAFRRSELVALNVKDVQETADGLVITLSRSKTDQEGVGRKVGIPYGSTPDTCPVRAYRRWMEASAITAGPVFRSVNRHGQIHTSLSAQSVALIVKRYAQAAGLDWSKYAGHSLRAGLATSAAIAGVSEMAIMRQTGHKSTNMVRRYIRDANIFRENAAARIGL